MKELHECMLIKGQLTNVHGLPLGRPVGQPDTAISTNQALYINQRPWKVDIQMRQKIQCLFPLLREKRSDAGSAGTQRTGLDGHHIVARVADCTSDGPSSLGIIDGRLDSAKLVIAVIDSPTSSYGDWISAAC